jgi:hypothetical protein
LSESNDLIKKIKLAADKNLDKYVVKALKHLPNTEPSAWKWSIDFTTNCREHPAVIAANAAIRFYLFSRIPPNHERK